MAIFQAILLTLAALGFISGPLADVPQKAGWRCVTRPGTPDG